MYDSFISKIKSNINEMIKHKGKSFFTIGTTTKQEKYSYVTPLRLNNDFCIAGCIIFDFGILSELIKYIDGKVDFVLVDSEKKLPLKIKDNSYSVNTTDIFSTNTVGVVDTSNFSRYCFNNITKSKVFEFKPNDLTVNATWSFISQKSLLLSGKKISILGSGNIGSKLALKLVESGANVHLYRQDSYKGYTIEKGLNFIKSKNTIANVHFHEDILQCTFQSDIIIGATDGYPIITKEIIKTIKRQCLVIDLGKNNILNDAIKLAKSNDLEIWRVDITSALEGYIYEVLRLNNLLENSYGIRKLGYCNIIGGGYLGAQGDIVVDKLNNPSYIVGVANGDGTFKIDLDTKDLENIEKLKENFNIKG